MPRRKPPETPRAYDPAGTPRGSEDRGGDDRIREERRIVEGLRAGDEDALRQLYARYGRTVFAVGTRLLGSREAAEELTQDVFLAAWRKIDRFDPDRGRLSTWIMTIAHNLGIDRLRRETGPRRPTLVLVEHLPDAVGEDANEGFLERDVALRALAPLTPSERVLLMRAYFGGLSAREIAEADGTPLGTVKTRLRTALIKVRAAQRAQAAAPDAAEGAGER
ncbi:MAG: RNA polymerase sigma factor [Actinomycetota bacterium]